jgi:site-specific recombinase XerD
MLRTVSHSGERAAIKAWLAERQKMTLPQEVEELFISLEHLAIHPHMLRHSSGYVLVNKGIDNQQKETEGSS